MKELKLQGTNKVALVDDEDFDRVSIRAWQITKIENTEYVITVDNNKQERLWLHVFILGKQEGKVIDHINRNGLDNQKTNLRHVTVSQNLHNTGPSKVNTTGYKGVRFSGTGKYRAMLIVNKVKVLDKTFKNIHDAARCWNEAARKHLGEFAFQNIIEE